MENMTKEVISMLVSSDKITLFTIKGELIEIRNDEDYDTAKIAEFLTPKLTGLAAVEINLNEFSRIAQILPSDLESEGIVITQVINGREVQGIFYPRKVAVQVTVGEDKIIVPDIENLTGHIKQAVKDNSPSVANFLKRLAPVLASRKHSGEDLMKFIKLSEMPLTNDGRIIAYKRVNVGSEKGTFVDVHTGKVKQRIGTRVTMKVDLVDSSRHNSCSTGLHVANLGYMRGFSGSNTLIVLVNPEDFIAVPKGEDTKARVCAYEVIGVMNRQAHDTVNTGTHISNDDELKKLIKEAVEGRHFQPIEEVEVGESGQMLSTKALRVAHLNKTPVTVVAQSSGTSLNEGKTTDQPNRDVLNVTRAAQASITGEVMLPDDVREAFNLLNAGHTKTAVADCLFTSTRSIGRWMEKWNYDAYKAAYEASVKAASEPVKEPVVDDENFAKLVQSSETPKPMTKAEQGQKLYNAWVLGGFKEEDLKLLKDFKAKAKKSWESLGFTEIQEMKISSGV